MKAILKPTKELDVKTYPKKLFKQFCNQLLFSTELFADCETHQSTKDTQLQLSYVCVSKLKKQKLLNEFKATDLFYFFLNYVIIKLNLTAECFRFNIYL